MGWLLLYISYHCHNITHSIYEPLGQWIGVSWVRVIYLFIANFYTCFWKQNFPLNFRPLKSERHLSFRLTFSKPKCNYLVSWNTIEYPLLCLAILLYLKTLRFDSSGISSDFFLQLNPDLSIRLRSLIDPGYPIPRGLLPSCPQACDLIYNSYFCALPKFVIPAWVYVF